MQAEQKTVWNRIRDILLAPFEGINRFILSDVREGRLSLAGMSHSVKSIVYIGFIVLLIANVMILTGDPFRQSSTLLAIDNPDGLLRGVNLPSLAFPFTLFLIVLAWGFFLSGTIRAARWIKWSVLVVFYIFLVPQWGVSVLSLGLNLSIGRVLMAVCSTLGLIVILVYSFAARWVKQPRPAMDFCVMFVCSGFALNVLQIAQIGGGTLIEQSSIAIQLSANILPFFLLVFPFVIQLGMEIAKFVLDLSFWSAEIIRYRFARRPWAIYIALFALTVLQLNAIGQRTADYFQTISVADGLRGYLGNGIIILIVWAVWWFIYRVKPTHFRFVNNDKLIEHTDSLVPPTILLMISVPILALLATLVISLAVIPVVFFEGSDNILSRSFELADLLISDNLLGVYVASSAAFVWGMVELRRDRSLRANYLLLFGFFFLWRNVTRLGQPLETLGWSGTVPIDFWWSVLLLGIMLTWLARRQLTTERAISLLILTIINTLVFRQTDFIEDPFYRLLEFSGTGLIVFGILWDAVTIGHWANADTPALPRQSRVFLYLGYVIITVAVIYWAIAQHDHFWINQFTGEGALAGLTVLGLPMLYMLYPLLLMLPKDQTPLQDPAKSQSRAVTDSSAAA